jgi:hypothetical protein
LGKGGHWRTLFLFRQRSNKKCLLAKIGKHASAVTWEYGKKQGKGIKKLLGCGG